MSGADNPKGNPVKPPIPNIGKNDNAKSIGIVKRIDPPHSDKKKTVRIITDGIEIIMVVAWKKALMVVPIPVKNIWWAQTIKDMTPRKRIAYTKDL